MPSAKLPGITDLAVTKSDSSNPVYAGAYLTYNLTVINNGPILAIGVILTVTENEFDSNLANNTATVVTTVTPSVDLSITKTLVR